MFGSLAKVLPDNNTLRLAMHQLTRPSTVSAGQGGTFSRARSTEEKLTGILIILSILALILTF
jgi:hypothetical protein